MRVFVLLTALLGGPALATDEGAALPVKRCGWFVNPTPNNAWLVDRDGEWTLSTQGGRQAEGDWPVFGKREWVENNGHYGYGCACMKLVAGDPGTQEIARIVSAEARPLSVCRKDRRLRSEPP